MSRHATPAAPDEGVCQEMHHALLRADPTAPSDFARAVLDPLAAWLRTRNAGASPDLCDEAAVQTVHAHLLRPEKYDTERGMSLWRYLQMAAQGDLLNLLHREKRHRHLPLNENDVVLTAPGGNARGRSASPLQALCDAEDEQLRQKRLQALRTALTEPEQRVLDLLIAGERRTSLFAAALGLDHRSAAEQKAEVKRVKDRLMKRLRRRGMTT